MYIVLIVRLNNTVSPGSSTGYRLIAVKIGPKISANSRSKIYFPILEPEILAKQRSYHHETLMFITSGDSIKTA